MNLNNYQKDVVTWMLEVFGPEIQNDQKERLHRFLEEALELVQSLGYTKEEVTTMVEYVFSRPIGNPRQEIGGVLHCLAALSSRNGIIMSGAAEDVLKYCQENGDKIREKHSNKPDSIVSSKNYNGKETNTLPGPGRDSQEKQKR